MTVRKGQGFPWEYVSSARISRKRELVRQHRIECAKEQVY